MTELLDPRLKLILNAVDHELRNATHPDMKLSLAMLKSAIADAATMHLSDCAMHNDPAYKPGPCDCGASGG